MKALKLVVQRGLFILACAATACFLFYRIEDFRGASAWAAYSAGAEKRGVKLDFKDYIPAPIPDDSNFAAMPLIKELSSFHGNEKGKEIEALLPPRVNLSYPGDTTFDLKPVRDELAREKYIGKSTDNPTVDILAAMQRCEPILAPLREAAVTKPDDQLIVEQWTQGLGSSMRQCGGLINICVALGLHCGALLTLDEHEKALADLRAIDRISDAFEGQPTLLAAMLRVIATAVSLADVRMGITLNRWSVEDMVEIDERLRDINLEKDAIYGSESERALNNLTMDQLKEFGPSERRRMLYGTDEPGIGEVLLLEFMPCGWIDQNKVRLNEWFDRSSPEDRVAIAVADWKQLPYWLIAARATHFMGQDVEIAADTQVELNTCRVALALRRFRILNGHYPERLEELVPVCLPALPDLRGAKDIAKYQRTSNGAVLKRGDRVLQLPGG